MIGFLRRVAPPAVVTMAVLGGGACDSAFDTSTSWFMGMAAPAADAAGFVDWCPAIVLSTFDPLTGQPTQAPRAVAPKNIGASISVENDDIYTVVPAFNTALFGGQFSFDIGPIGTFYAQDSFVATINTDGTVPAAQPVQIPLEITVVEGTRQSDTKFEITLDYAPNCGEAGTATNGTETCTCETTRVTWQLGTTPTT